MEPFSQPNPSSRVSAPTNLGLVESKVAEIRKELQKQQIAENQKVQKEVQNLRMVIDEVKQEKHQLEEVIQRLQIERDEFESKWQVSAWPRPFTL